MIPGLPVALLAQAGGTASTTADAAAAAGSNPVFWVILLGYFVAVLGFGSWFARFNRTTSDFFFGGRRFAWWLITMSIVATGVGSHSFVKYSGMGFRHGLSSTMAYMNDWFFMPLFMFGWLPIVYYMRLGSIPEYFQRRFDARVRALATIAILLFMVGYVGIGFATMAKTLLPVLQPYGWSLGGIIWAVAAVAGIYITFGGQTAVIFTDLLQGFILLVAGLLLFLLGLEWLGGFDVFWKALPDDFRLPLADFNRPAEFNFAGIFWQDGIAGSIGFLFMNQGLIMRFLACRSVGEGRKAATFNVLVILPISALVVSGAGWIGKAISVSHPELIPEGTAPDEIFTRVASIVASPAGFGFFVAAVTAALMSTVDTLINAVAAVVINDVYRPIRPGRNDRHYLRVAMVVSALATLVGVAGAFVFTSFASLYQAHAFFHATFTPPLVAAIFLGIFWPRFTTPAAMATFLGGTALMIAGGFWPAILIRPFSHGIPMDPEHPYTYIRALYNLVACFGIGIVATLLTRPKPREDLAGLTMWTAEAARRFFKGGKPNDRRGRKVTLRWAVDTSLPEGGASVDREQMEALAAERGDLLYVCDRRWWLGGLRSSHARLAAVHEGGEEIRLAADLAASGRFLPGRAVTVEKEL